jgi:dihydroneopterin aldolase/2-amino-4-hydroxy-6-hydroxymethyldihydropteridine diphosphokinase
MTTLTPDHGARRADHAIAGDHITVSGLRAFAHHGVYQHEKDAGQEFIIDVTVWLDVHAAASGDDLGATVNYGELAEGVVHAVEADPVDLIETVAERVAALALSFAAVRRTRVTLHKPHAPITVPFDDVAVTIDRDRSPETSFDGSHPVVLALGSNLGEREAELRGAIADLAGTPGIRITAVSGLYASPALTLHGVDRDAPGYLNAVVLASTRLHPYALLETTSMIEEAHGRERTERWGARTLDIDIIDYAGRQSDDARLTLPHPRAAERAFVLVPWLEVDPEAHLAGRGLVADLVRQASDDATLRADKRWADAAWSGRPDRPDRHEAQ